MTIERWTAENAVARLANLFEDDAPDAHFESMAAGKSDYIDAAAVLACFDFSQIQPAGADPDPETAKRFLEPVSERTVNEQGDARWRLRREVQRNALAKLIRERRVQELLQAAPGRERGPVQVTIEAYLLGQPPNLDTASIEQLREVQIAVGLLEGLVPDLPSQDTLRTRLECEALLSPFRALIGDGFAGRQKELNQLSDYVDLLDATTTLESITRNVRAVFSIVDEPPLFVHGPGGIGKSTLIAKFILDHLQHGAPRMPFAYLDIDRPGLVPEEPITLLIEALRQFAIEYPHARERLHGLRREWNARISADAAAGQQSGAGAPRPADPAMRTPGPAPSRRGNWSTLRLRDRDFYIETFAAAVKDLQTGPTPILFVLDTFEEVQLRSAALVEEMFGFLDALQHRIPFLRVVISGRVAVNSKRYRIKELPLMSFDTDSAIAYLMSRSQADEATARGVANQLKGSPLTLKLAADLLKKEPVTKDGLTQLSTGFIGELWKGTIEAQLYTRVLRHIKDPDVRQLAHPGLVLRRITPKLIRDVLAGPCGLSVPDLPTAERLFEKLRDEVVLVTQESPRVLLHRADLRAVMLEPLLRAEPVKVKEIHERAVKFYESAAPSPENRAEEIYHRLSLGFDRPVLESRWVDGLGKPLSGSLPELSTRAQAYLAARLMLVVAPEVWAAADQEDWEVYATRAVEENLRFGRTDEAVALLRQRTARLPDSPLLPLEVQALTSLGRVEEASSVAAAALTASTPGSQTASALKLQLEQLRSAVESGPREPDGSNRKPRKRPAAAFAEVVDAINDAFSGSRELVSALTGFQLPSLETFASGQMTFHEVSATIVDTADRQGWLPSLMLALRRVRPGNLPLWLVGQHLQLAARSSDAEIQRFAEAGGVRPYDLRERLTVREAQTCVVGINVGPASFRVTGFLVGPDLVLTSSALTARAGEPVYLPDIVRQITVVFDGWPTRPEWHAVAKTYTLATDDCLVASGYVPRGSSGPDLGYLLIRLADRAGDAPGAASGKRGWMQLSSRTPKRDLPIAMLRGTASGALVFSTQVAGPVEWHDEAVRVEYQIESDAWASGAPCFDAKLQVIAVHLASQESWLDKMRTGRGRSGVPVHAIVADLARQHVTLEDEAPNQMAR